MCVGGGGGEYFFEDWRRKLTFLPPVRKMGVKLGKKTNDQSIIQYLINFFLDSSSDH